MFWNCFVRHFRKKESTINEHRGKNSRFVCSSFSVLSTKHSLSVMPDVHRIHFGALSGSCLFVCTKNSLPSNLNLFLLFKKSNNMTVKIPRPSFRPLAALAIFLFATLWVSCEKEELFNDPSTDANELLSNAPSPTGDLAVTDRASSPPPVPRLAIKMILAGPYNSSTQLMNDDLRAKSLVPSSTPYSTPNNEVISSPTTVFGVTGNNAIVDWVKVELRTGNTTVVKEVSGLLQRDGDVVDTDGVTALGFPGASNSTAYQVAVFHRNHLGCLTTGTFTLSTSSPPTVDLTSASTGTWSSSSAVGRYQISGGTEMVLFAGDVERNQSPFTKDLKVKYQGPGKTDSWEIFYRVLTDPANINFSTLFIVADVYDSRDVNMDGNIINQGPNHDKTPVFFSVMSSPLNTSYLANFIVNEAIP